MSERPIHRRPWMPGAGHFEALPGESAADPAVRTEAADRCATLLVRGTHGTDDESVVSRVVSLADSEGIETLAELWAGSPADSLAGCLWRLYLLRSWVYADPAAAAREFDVGRRETPVHEAVAGVVEPPGPDEDRDLVDQVLRGVVVGDFADTLYRAAAFARVAAAGRSLIGAPEEVRDNGAWERAAATYRADLSAAKLVTMADQLEHAARLELLGQLA
jgi:hypothetical protein